MSTKPTKTPERARGVWPFYLVFLAGLGVSVNTSWRFFDVRLHIPEDYGERYVMFAVVELALGACWWAMRAAVRRGQPAPLPVRLLTWSLCGFSAYMAVDLSGLAEGIARVLLGPVLAIIGLHLALGIELRVARGARVGAWGRVLRELRERVLSRLGLGNDKRDAAERIRDRATDRAARLAVRGWPRRTARLERAIRTSCVATDPDRRRRMLEQVAAYRNIDALKTITLPSPWVLDTPADMGADIGYPVRVTAVAEPVMSEPGGYDLVIAAPRAGIDQDTTAEYAQVGSDDDGTDGRTRDVSPEARKIGAVTLAAGGLPMPVIAEILGVTERHARRLAGPVNGHRVN